MIVNSANSPIRRKTTLHTIFYNRYFHKNQSLRKHHSLSKIKLSYEKPEERRKNSIESQQQRKTSSSQNFTKFPCQIYHKLLLLRNTNNNMSAAKVRVHNTSTSSIDAVIEPLQHFKVDTSKLRAMGFTK